ncbi:MAG: PP2C family protein-serine/threonine phosphatase [Blastocatellia bacterium]|nr:PP2C family protein-serine/threonine phosphatase [Blastocatellia bacterium]
MTRRLFLLLSLGGIAGYALFFFLFPRFSPIAKWGHELDRQTAASRAAAAGRAFGVDPAGWTTWVSTSYDQTIESYLFEQKAAQKTPLLDARLTPTRMKVTFADLKSGHRLIVSLNSRGELLEIEHRDPASPPRRPPGGGPRGNRPGPPGREDPPPNTNQSEADLARDLRIAEEGLRNFYGEAARAFPSPPKHGAQATGNEYSWTSSDDLMKLTAEVYVQNGKLQSLKLDSSPTETFKPRLDARRPGSMAFFSNVANFVLWPSIIALIILYFVGLGRRQVNHRPALYLLLGSFVFLTVANYLGSFFDNFREDVLINNGPRPLFLLQLLLPPLIYLAIYLAISGSLYFFHATGSAISGGLVERRTIDLELLLKGGMLTRPVMGSLLAGLLAGGGIAVTPYLIAASGLFGPVALDPAELDDIFSARWPIAASAIDFSQFVAFMVFAFLTQIIDTFVRRRFLALLLTYLTTFLSFAEISQIQIPLAAAVAVTAVIALILTCLYYRFGVLATFFSLVGWQIALSAAILLAQPAASLHGSGVRILGLLLAFGLVGLVGFWKSREVTAEEVAPRDAAPNVRAERERLKAEFDVARRAQEHMLPDAPPALPGFRISAICQPSKEVGGDLYDFLRLPDGRTGIVVADVSGKGVPASLYMTLTKGLLDSVSEDKSDPGEILREVNRHLYTVCQRKMFVTLFLGVLDPAGRTLSYARAGHNPTVHRRAFGGETLLLKPRGMGLGLNSGKIFDQSLKVETIQLESRDKLFFYSDGITEAMNVQNDEYGEERLMKVAEEVDDLPAEASLNAVMDDVRKFLGPNPPQDDQTLVVIEVM